MMITKEEIEAVKRSKDLISVIQSRGIELKKKGKNFVALCPFHTEKTPSFTVNPRTNLWHCFGCNAGGDVIGFLCKTEDIGFREAMERLTSSKLKAESSKVKAKKAENQEPDASNPSSTLNRTHLLNRVVSFYHQSFLEDRRALEYVKERGITDEDILLDFKVGFSNGTLLNTIPDEGEVIDGLKAVGILNERGHEMFYHCVVFPIFDENKDCVGMYGRKLDGNQNSQPATRNTQPLTHLYLPGPRKGVFNHQAIKRSKSLILTESIIDCLTLHNAGFKDVIPCYGVNGLTEDHLSLFNRHKTKEVYICFDGDDAGREGTLRISQELKERGLDVYTVDLPQGEDINSYLNGRDPKEFEALLKKANPGTPIRSDKAVKQEKRHYEKTDTGFTVQYGERTYEVKGINREGVKLKATIKAIKQRSAISGQQSGETRNSQLATRFHLDTVDLYSMRSRSSFVRACCQLFSEKEPLITGDIDRIIELAEGWKGEDKEEALTPQMTRVEEDEAIRFLKAPDLFKVILEDFETIGCTGEEANKLIGYLAALSRKLEEPLSILIQSRSAAGKSTLQDAILSLIPAEDYVKYTRLTNQALFYKEEDSLVHKVLAIEEEHGARDASYSIRNIQSSKYLSIAATGKDPATGKLRTEEYKVKGPVALMITTTEAELDYETQNRFITLSIDESKEMTERILNKQREQETLEGLVKKIEVERVIKRHQNAQRLLRPLHVINPYASYLTFPSESLRTRRDHKKYLGLIKAIAFLYQYQREIKSVELPSMNGTGENESIQYIEVTLEDIEQANKLANEVLGRTLDELSPPSRALLKMIKELVEMKCREEQIEPKEYHFTRKDVRDYIRWSDFQIKCHIRQLEELEYLYSVTGKKGKEYVYELLYQGGGEDGNPFCMGLMDIKQLKEKIAQTNKPGGQKDQLGGYL